MTLLKLAKSVLLITSAAILISCSTAQYKPLKCPDKPYWNKIKATDFECVTDEIWAKLDKREAIQAGYILKLEALCEK